MEYEALNSETEIPWNEIWISMVSEGGVVKCQIFSSCNISEVAVIIIIIISFMQGIYA